MKRKIQPGSATEKAIYEYVRVQHEFEQLEKKIKTVGDTGDAYLVKGDYAMSHAYRDQWDNLVDQLVEISQKRTKISQQIDPTIIFTKEYDRVTKAAENKLRFIKCLNNSANKENKTQNNASLNISSTLFSTTLWNLPLDKTTPSLTQQI